MKRKLIDCITFFQENFIFKLRYKILKDVINEFIVCESIYDHQGNKKKINFNLENKNYRDKIIHIIHNKKFRKQNKRNFKVSKLKKNIHIILTKVIIF